MAVRFDIRIRNVVGSVPSALRGEATRITNAGLRIGEGVAKARAPVRTGFLRSTIGVKMLSLTSGVLEAKANYAGYVNYGTRRMAARPFMDAGAKATEDYIRGEWRGVEGRLPRVGS